MKISVVIPTWKRPDFLAMTLRGLANQSRQPDEVILGVRRDDKETIDYLDQLNDFSPRLDVAYLDVPGVIQSMDAAAHKASGDIIVLFDDDAEPLPLVLEQMEAHFTSKPLLGALGGRDLLQYLTEEELDASLEDVVGLFTTTGQLVGNHHCGRGGYRAVDILKGCILACRGELLKTVGFEKRLLGRGAQAHWEMALCLDVKTLGFEVGYDPRIQVKHHVAPRNDDDQNHRGGFYEEGIYNLAYNICFVIWTRANPIQRTAFQLRATFCGSRIVPGFAQWVRHKIQGNPHAKERWRAARRGNRDGRLAARATKTKGCE